jgi:allantoinase
LKQWADFFAIWGGISGIQHGFPLVISEALAGGISDFARQLMASLLAANVARRFKLPHKGRIAVGNDADFALLDLEAEHVLTNDELLYRHKQGPYAGRKCRVRVARTFVRGCAVWREGGIAPGAFKAQFIRPTT